MLTPQQPGPERVCHDACRARTQGVCDDDQCWRGCNFVLDRIVEREGDVVLRCVGHSTRGCGDTVWAECAARVGPHIDGGPTPPAPDTFDDED